MQEKCCFVISPIETEGTEDYEKFKFVFEKIIQPAINDSGYVYSVVRADEIHKSGSFIKHILEHLHSSYLVIADLTKKNPNVFYELGVRHCLSPRTILISQTMDDVPSDLRQYRVIKYDTSISGIKIFKEKIKLFLQEIDKDPEHRDNPVLDRIDSITERIREQLNQTREAIKDEIAKKISDNNQLRHLEGYWLQEIPQLKESNYYTIAKIVYNEHAHCFEFSGTNYMNDGTPRTAWNTLYTHVNIHESQFIYILHAHEYLKPGSWFYGYGVIYLEREKENKLTFLGGFFQDAQQDEAPQHFTLRRIGDAMKLEVMGSKAGDLYCVEYRNAFIQKLLGLK